MVLPSTRPFSEDSRACRSAYKDKAYMRHLVTIVAFVQYSVKGYVDLRCNMEKAIRQTYLDLRQDLRQTYGQTYDGKAARLAPSRAELAQLFRLAATNIIAQTLEPCLYLRHGGASHARVIAARLCQPRENWRTAASVKKFDKLGRVEMQL